MWLPNKKSSWTLAIGNHSHKAALSCFVFEWPGTPRGIFLRLIYNAHQRLRVPVLTEQGKL